MPGSGSKTEHYFLSADGKLMPTRKDQPPPDLRYFTRRNSAAVRTSLDNGRAEPRCAIVGYLTVDVSVSAVRRRLHLGR